MIDINAIVLAVVGALVTIVTPLATVLATTWAKSADRREDRRDRAALAHQVSAAAKKAEAAAHQAVGSNIELKEQVKDVSNKAMEADKQLKQIHVFVNHNLSSAISEALDAKVATLAALKEVARLKSAAGETPSADSLALIVATQNKIDELTKQLADRKKADEEAAQKGVA